MDATASTRNETRSTQYPHGIEWTIWKYRNNKASALHNGTIRDISLFTCALSTDNVGKSMINVARVAPDLEEVERKLMHI